TGLAAEPPVNDPTGRSLPLPPDTVLNRGDKDRAEGFGRVNVDAAVEASTQTLALGAPVTATLGPGPRDKKVWARSVTLNGGTAYSFSITNPSNSDYDLYVYSDTPI